MLITYLFLLITWFVKCLCSGIISLCYFCINISLGTFYTRIRIQYIQ